MTGARTAAPGRARATAAFRGSVGSRRRRLQHSFFHLQRTWLLLCFVGFDTRERLQVAKIDRWKILWRNFTKTTYVRARTVRTYKNGQLRSRRREEAPALHQARAHTRTRSLGYVVVGSQRYMPHKCIFMSMCVFSCILLLFLQYM